MKLIDEWKQAWRYLSVQVNAFAAMFAIVFMTLPREDQTALLSLLPFGDHSGAMLVLLLVVIQTLARLKAQPGLRE